MKKFDSVRRFVNRSGLKLQKHSPQILFYGGLVGVVATTVLSSRATLKAVPVIEEHKEARGNLDVKSHDNYVTTDEYTRIATQQYTVTVMSLAKLYAPTILVGGISIAALTKSHRQLTSRNTALTVAYTGLFKTFESYRNRVREQLGDEIDQQLMHGTVQQQLEYEDKQGKTRTKEITALDPSSSAALTYMFDSNAPSWCKDPGYNQAFLDNQQRWANIMLQKQGHLFLNEVYDMLHIPHTREGNILGWVFDDLGNNDMFVELGHHKDGEFMAGFKRDVMLEFNIHGPILDLI